jgi:peptidoglycan/xylan/chitin deacetylase (PgdA/CDA1 family)
MAARGRVGVHIFAGLLAAGLAGWALAEVPADNGAVVVMYHRFGESDLPSTNIRLDQFEAHIAELTSGAYTILPVPEIVAALNENRPLPERTVGITIDDAFASVYAEAWPRLRAVNLPFTLFVATDALDRGLRGYMTWGQVREMVAGGNVTIGHHGVGHGHMVSQSAAATRTELTTASSRFQEELRQVPELFAYPYGEYGVALRDMVAEAGFAAAFGQQSGAIARNGDRFALPRFPFNETYGDMDRFSLAVNSLPLPVHDMTPADTLVRPAGNPPPYGFTVDKSISGVASLNCFASTGESSLERLGERRIEVRLAQPLESGRARINCTMPGPDGRWRWLGMQFYMLP